MNQQIKPSEIVLLISGAVAFLFSFFSYVDQGEFGISPSAWNGEYFFPLPTYVAVFGLLIATHVALAKLAGLQFPEQILSFTWPQIHFALAAFCGLISIGYLILGEDLAIGFWLMTFASIGMIVGAVMELLEATKAGVPGAGPYPGPGQPPPQQF